jgi:hypothetical protein
MDTTANHTRPATAHRRKLLDRAVRLDALVSGAAGVVLAAGAPVLDGTLGAPVSVLVPLGLFLVAYAAFLVVVARAGSPPAAVKLVIAGNAVWVVASLVTVAADWLTLTTAGNVLALAQAAAVALIAELQVLGLRRAR